MVFAEGAAPDVSGQLFQYGILGVFAALMIYVINRLFTLVIENNKRETARADRAEEQNRLLNEEVRDKVVPELIRNADTTARLLARLDERRP